jgi:hypothetical protein
MSDTTTACVVEYEVSDLESIPMPHAVVTAFAGKLELRVG